MYLRIKYYYEYSSLSTLSKSFSVFAEVINCKFSIIFNLSYITGNDIKSVYIKEGAVERNGGEKETF